MLASALVIPRDEEAGAAARSFFRSRGFEVTEPYAGSFSISAPQDTFEATFGTRLVHEGPDGAVKAETPRGAADRLPLDRLPPDLAGSIEVLFPPPPAFGPTRW
jgi:hypothetical protein